MVNLYPIFGFLDMQDKMKFMLAALSLASDNIKFKNGGPFGAIVVKDGKIIGRGINSVTANNDPTAHAEINAIREACEVLQSYQLTGCEIYSSCEPCPMCMGAIYWARPRKLYFAASRNDAAKAGFQDEFIYEEMKLLPNKRNLPMEQILRPEAKKILETWSTIESKIHY